MFLLLKRSNESDGVRGRENVAFENPLYSTSEAFVSNTLTVKSVADTDDSGYLNVQGTNADDADDMGVPAPGGDCEYLDVSPDLDGECDC